MRTLANVIWFCLAGLWLWLGYVLAGVLACLGVITIPFGVASFRMASLVAWPFGREAVRSPSAGAPSALANGLWFLLAGWWLALLHVVTALLQALTVIGIPNAIVSLKLVPLSLSPFGTEIVSR